MVRKYLSQMVIILDYLHSDMKVAHRDLKPENFLLDSNRHLKLSDFGSAIEIGIDKDMTEAGTQNYAAPEMLLGKETGLSVDLWSLGCILYEMVVGKPPFRSHNLFSLIETIEQKNIIFPLNFPEHAKDLCLSLLQINETQRLGFGTINEIKAHKFFEGIDFDNVWSEAIISNTKETGIGINIIPEYIPIVYCPSSNNVIKQEALFIKDGCSYREELVKLTEDGKLKFTHKKKEVQIELIR